MQQPNQLKKIYTISLVEQNHTIAKEATYTSFGRKCSWLIHVKLWVPAEALEEFNNNFKTLEAMYEVLNCLPCNI